MTNQDILEKQQFWRDKYEEFKKSNLSQNKFCKQEGLIPHKCSYYFLKFRKEEELINVQRFSQVVVQDEPELKTIDPVWLARFLKNLL